MISLKSIRFVHIIFVIINDIFEKQKADYFSDLIFLSKLYYNTFRKRMIRVLEC